MDYRFRQHIIEHARGGIAIPRWPPVAHNGSCLLQTAKRKANVFHRHASSAYRRTPGIKNRRADTAKYERQVVAEDALAQAQLSTELSFRVRWLLDLRYASNVELQPVSHPLEAFVAALDSACRTTSSSSYTVRDPTLAVYRAIKSQHMPTNVVSTNRSIDWLAEKLSTTTYRSLAIMMIVFQSLDGDLDATMLLLNSHRRQHKAGAGGHARNDFREHRKILLRAITDQSNHASWQAVLLEGRILESEGRFNDALLRYQQAIEWKREADQGDATKDASHVEQHQYTSHNLQLVANVEHPPLRGLQDLDRPWYYAIKLCLKLAAGPTPPSREYWFNRAKRYNEAGFLGDDAESHYIYAGMTMDNYRHDEVQHLSRPEVSIFGQSAEWLYIMTKAAASGVPQACYELGNFYAKQTWPYLDSEPLATTKPTTFDRYPLVKPKERISSWRTRLMRAVGFPISDPLEEDSYYLAAIQASASDRIAIAIHWLEAAEALNYPPALVLLAQIYAAPEIQGNLAVPDAALNLSRARFHYSGELEYKAAVERQMEVHRSTAEDRPPIKNGFRDLNKAKAYVGKYYNALEARERYIANQEKAAAGKKPEQPSPPTTIAPVVQRWTVEEGIFAEWMENDEVHALDEKVIKKLCQDYMWSEIYDEAGRLVFQMPGRDAGR